MRKYHVELVAIGNGTASRETERFYLDVQKQFPNVTAQKVIVSEAGRPFIPLLSWRRRSFRIWMFLCAARCPLPAVYRTRWLNW
ncbi:transcription accessory protein [Salmonella enterica subsp. arizonae]|uniref:Transcription accessory protein n=1 Tax=Salmonella enterica subsp. arizonae TaxID=59203 RepID=A0A447QX44_SALER|nr:transcription accessory protein [Salmonella enterica subsp. arizonae]